ncbi:unnamed protein product [Bursaphelenchus okinawaensis]|uniref:LicD family protein n=1 Tax=Bursaphelenchus okinawaensis TaxID=465554 RepID=A0A811L6Q7_9BILA|nr:unnamed protein product [Bursaphelenchus okinawaensis]CAG9119261.1 unnamed protein product [Bursaphelenchus okinawaensis]
MTYFVLDKQSNDHIKLFGMLTNEVNVTQSRILPRFATRTVTVIVNNNATVTIDIPVDLDKFWFYWSKSNFIKCRKLSMKRSNTTRLIPKHKVSVLSKYREFADKWNTTFQIACGTLLGWYRECDLIPSTQDIDLTGPSSLIRPSFMKSIQSKYDVRSVYGNDEDSLELNWVYHGVRTDLFFKYPHNGTHEKIGALDFANNKQIMSYYPKSTGTCAGDLHGVLVYVPCNAEEILVSEYGDYAQDIELKQYSYASNPANIVAGPAMEAEMFARLSRTSWP